MKDIDRRRDKFLVFLAVYTLGVFFGIFLYALRVINWICSSWGVKVVHKERLRLPKDKRGVLIVSNHPSLLEPFLLPCLFFWKYVLHPIRLSPWALPDSNNYYNKWYWAWLRVRLVPIDRENGKNALRSLRKVKKILDHGGIVIIFPEGGRTCNGDKFFTSRCGKKLRTLKDGVGWLISKANPLVLPLWIKGADKTLPNKAGRLYHTFPRFWHKTTIKIGKAFRLNGINREEIIQEITLTLLKLADEGE